MRIIMVGIRGIPANYGGFETCVEQITNRLSKNSKVIVYARSQYYPQKRIKYNENTTIVYLPTIRVKFLDTFVHSLLTLFHIIYSRNFLDSFIFVFNSANSIPLFPLPLLKSQMAINTDGVEWKREKWGFWGRNYYKLSEWLATKSFKHIITDSKGMSDYYSQRYNCRSTIIEYGAEVTSSINNEVLKKYFIEPQKYYLQITRFEPENNPLLTIKAFNIFKRHNKSNLKLIIIGDVPYESEYSIAMKTHITDDVLLPGFIYDKKVLNELRTNALAYIHGNQVGGTNPALLEAMGAGCFVIARDVGFNREVLEDGGLYFKQEANDLANQMLWVVSNQQALDSFKTKNVKKIKDYYNWDRISKLYYKITREEARHM